MLNRNKLKLSPLSSRHNRLSVESDSVSSDAQPSSLSASASSVVDLTVERLRNAREKNRPRIMAFGAHSIKNGLGPLLGELIRTGWVTHLATNGAGVIHDWEFAYQGESSEDVKQNIVRGSFGIWDETGYYINLALIVGAYQGLGYGESVGKFIAEGEIDIPTDRELKTQAESGINDVTHYRKAAAALDFLSVKQEMSLPTGKIEVPHPWSDYSIQKTAYQEGVSFTAHPMFGHDIIYTHPLNHGASIGRTAERDFLCFADSVSRIDEGVYLSIGSAVMSPMVFEKSFSMAQNLSLQTSGTSINNHTIVVVDLAESNWDWSRGEPPEDRPEYYMRYCKTFSRMGGDMHYACADNRDFLLTLVHRLIA